MAFVFVFAAFLDVALGMNLLLKVSIEFKCSGDVPVEDLSPPNSRQRQDGSSGLSKTSCPTKCGNGLTFRRIESRISGFDRELFEIQRTTTQRPQCGMMNNQSGQLPVQVMNSRNGQRQFCLQRFQVFLRTLLAMKTNRIMVWLVSTHDRLGEVKVGVGFANPRSGFLSHTALFLA